MARLPSRTSDLDCQVVGQGVQSRFGREIPRTYLLMHHFKDFGRDCRRTAHYYQPVEPDYGRRRKGKQPKVRNFGVDHARLLDMVRKVWPGPRQVHQPVQRIHFSATRTTAALQRLLTHSADGDAPINALYLLPQGRAREGAGDH